LVKKNPQETPQRLLRLIFFVFAYARQFFT